MPANMTATAWGQGCRNALIVGLGLLVVWGALAAAVVWVFEQPVFAAFGMAGAAICSVTLVLFLVSWLHGRRAGGRVLLDCGPHPTRALFLLQAVLFLVMALLNGLTATAGIIRGLDEGPLSNTFGIGWSLMLLAFVPYWLIMWGGRLQVREHGIWSYWGLLRWGKIRSYHWANDSTLIVKAKGPLSFLQGALPVAPEQRAVFEEQLAKRVANADEPAV
jgi:hypothetical protein